MRTRKARVLFCVAVLGGAVIAARVVLQMFALALP